MYGAARELRFAVLLDHYKRWYDPLEAGMDPHTFSEHAFMGFKTSEPHLERGLRCVGYLTSYAYS